MNARSIAIIGAGIAGLAAGCYAQMNGYRSRIFELHDLPGGLCTAWERKGYVFDGCIHYLFGSGQGQPFNDIWQELGALDGRTMVDHSEFMRLVASDGSTLIVYSDPDRLAQHMQELSPADASLIEAFAEGIRQFAHFDMSLLDRKPRSLFGPADGMNLSRAMLPFVPALARWGMVSAADFGARFKHPFLRRAVPLMFNWPEIPMMAGMAQLAYMHSGNAGFPIGGSLEFARAIERRYLELGGEIIYTAQVEKILVNNGRAVGVRLYNDDVYYADYVISAADGHATIFEMLDGVYTNRRIRAYYDGRLPIHSMIQVSLGVACDLSTEPHWATYLLDQPIVLAGEEHHEIGFKHYCFDPTLAPPGHSVLEVIIRADYDYWQRIYGRLLYKAEQDQVADVVLAEIERRYPDIRGKIEVSDVATPLSYERYTGNWRGSTCGWLLSKETMKLMLLGMPRTLPRLSNFYMAGQWVEPGGSVPLAAMSGRKAIQLICHDDRRPFEAWYQGGAPQPTAALRP